MYRDAVDPSLQARFAVEVLDAAEDFDEDVLHGVGGVGRVVHHAIDKAIDGLMIVRDQPRERLFGAGLQLGHYRMTLRCEPRSRWLHCPKLMLPPMLSWRHLKP